MQHLALRILGVLWEQMSVCRVKAPGVFVHKNMSTWEERTRERNIFFVVLVFYIIGAPKQLYSKLVVRAGGLHQLH